jgi:hypothetical protein
MRTLPPGLNGVHRIGESVNPAPRRFSPADAAPATRYSLDDSGYSRVTCAQRQPFAVARHGRGLLPRLDQDFFPGVAPNEAGISLMHKDLQKCVGTRPSLAPRVLLGPGFCLMTSTLTTNEAGMCLIGKELRI